MLVDVYDTYATAPCGTLLHFEVSLPAGTTPEAAARIAHEYVGGTDPEIETELTRRNANLHETAQWEVIRDLQQDGYAIMPLKRQAEAA